MTGNIHPRLDVHDPSGEVLSPQCPRGLRTEGIAYYDAIRYSHPMIKSFRGREAEKIWDGRVSTRLPQDIQRVARRKLRMLNGARSLEDLRIPPGNVLEALKGDRAGAFSIRINDQWRLCFRWDGGDAHDVEIADYH